MSKQAESHDGLDETDRKLVLETQAGLPVCSRPYRVVAETLGLSEEDVMRRLEAMLRRGIIRRIGLVPNHYKLGFRANGMSVWNVPDEQVEQCGAAVGQLDFVSHCYQRPRHRGWPYNLFAMVHGRTRKEVDAKVARIAEILGPADAGHDVLYSSRILKKTGLRLAKGN